ncbi:hypothetical protein [Marinobacter mangrovi]|uniref:hypothetical protein n=1 Tax=Marinobacter mangrovi TaxID=2803918 RepID=UPI001931DD23|nr:hypothetical protein [Marinobacter mangrovi]
MNGVIDSRPAEGVISVAMLMSASMQRFWLETQGGHDNPLRMIRHMTDSLSDYSAISADVSRQAMLLIPLTNWENRRRQLSLHDVGQVAGGIRL